MKKVLKYSVLRYSPLAESGEKINLGIIFSDEALGFRKFKYVKKFSRLTTFDDEIDLKMVKALLKGIQEEVDGNLFTYNSFDIDEFTKHYINSFCFDSPKSIFYDNLDEMIERLNKIYLRFDYEKSERPSKEDDKKFIESLISSNGIHLKKNECIIGPFNENITYDFVTEQYCVKVFDFDNKDLSKLINTAKSWGWNSLFNKSKKSIIIYRYTNEKDKYKAAFESIINIFKESQAEVFDISSDLSILNKIS